LAIEETTAADGRTELTAGIFIHQASSDQPIKMLACSLTFPTEKDAAATSASTPAAK
jgi:hypothetical protein